MATVSNTNETRLVFKLRDEDGNKKERTITIPGLVPQTSETIASVLTAYGYFRTRILNATPTAQDFDYRQFVQTSNWRDETGSSESSSGLTTYTTEDVEIEFYKVEKTRYGADDLNQ